MAEVRAAVRAVAEACDAPIECEDDLVQAVDEAVTNVIVHGYGGAPGGVDITVERDDEDIVITIEDTAPTFDPTSVADARPGRPARARAGPAGWASTSCARPPTRSTIDRDPAAAIS